MKITAIKNEIIDRGSSFHIHVVDEHPLRRASMRRFLEQAALEDRSAVEVTEGGLPLCEVESLGRHCLILLGVGGARSGSPEVLDLIDQARSRMPDAMVAILSEQHEASDVIAAIRAGARGVITTRIDPHLLLLALKFILGGGIFLPPDALLQRETYAPEAVPESKPVAESPNVGLLRGSDLTARQKEVLQLLKQGRSNKLIARELHMREPTVKVHVRQILRKLGAANRTQAALSVVNGTLPMPGSAPQKAWKESCTTTGLQNELEPAMRTFG
jgi:DNA-binding NarL/FixJ family response regulator